ncbi:hypothetical protein PS627_02874 [Pseudomonas fluorescens]|uniref:hypothetical protein n=1 Tax=Pseudomonas fluorescens TaxID=294 RepID=UPI0012573CA5|nr:hypothetical protein [Pseudomonas fluorescens]CAG8868111.1 hypothetical protein PS627_02874 [Pseudomonas fluorescens]VVP96144.1 hypothetical protein PS910_03355 [Pseudomonas fluorescens]
MDKALSFTATLWAGGHPLNFLAALGEGAVSVTRPGDPSRIIDGTRTLGVLDGTVEDWAHASDLGLVNFTKGAEQTPVLLYFRHDAGGYRIYVRDGQYLGHGVFCSKLGAVQAQPVEATDPARWHLRHPASGAAFDPLRHERDRFEIQLTDAEGTPVGMEAIYPVGGYLARYRGIRPYTVVLKLEARQVDWLGTD